MLVKHLWSADSVIACLSCLLMIADSVGKSFIKYDLPPFLRKFEDQFVRMSQCYRNACTNDLILF